MYNSPQRKEDAAAAAAGRTNGNNAYYSYGGQVHPNAQQQHQSPQQHALTVPSVSATESSPRSTALPGTATTTTPFYSMPTTNPEMDSPSQTTSYDYYGADTSSRTETTPILSHRTPHGTSPFTPSGASAMSYGGAVDQATTAASPFPSPSVVGSKIPEPSSTKMRYQHNTVMACFILPMLGMILLSDIISVSIIPTQIFLISCFLIYVFDLANHRDAFYYAIWIFVFINTLVSGWFWLLISDETTSGSDSDAGWFVIQIIFKVASTAMVYIVTACWIVLQINNNNNYNTPLPPNSNNETKKRHIVDDDDNYQLLFPSDIETMLHSIVPPMFAAFGCQIITTLIEEHYNDDDNDNDKAAIAAPHIFSILLFIALIFVGTCTNSFPNSKTNDGRHGGSTMHGTDEKEKGYLHQKMTLSDFAVRNASIVKGHILLLLLTPGVMHLFIFANQLFYGSSMDAWYDFLFTITGPYFLVYILQNHNVQSTTTTTTVSRRMKLQHNPYSDVPIIALDNNSVKNLTSVQKEFISFGMLAVTALMTSLALQQRYLIPLCRSFSYDFMGITHYSNWILSFYWTVATIALLSAFWLWGRTSSVGVVATEDERTAATTTASNQQQNQNLVLGEYQEDIVQIFLCAAGLCIGKAFGLAWNMIPLPVLGILGLSLWISSRLLRYLIVFLFVWHASGVVIFTYRYVGIEQLVLLSTLPPFSVGLLHFGLIITSASVLIGLTTGFAVRSKGGFMSSFLRRIDMTGQLFVLYTLLLTVLEITLLKLSDTLSELIGVETDEVDDDGEVLYDPLMIYLTSTAIIAMSFFMYRQHIVHKTASSVAIALTIGKALAVFVDSASEGQSGSRVFFQTLVTAALCLVIYVPRLFLQPVHMKSPTRYKRGVGGSGGSDLPAGTARTIVLYTFILLPLALFITIPYVLFPLVGTLTGGDYYDAHKAPILELIGAVLSVWGLSCLSMLNYYLPDGGGEAWKKLSALAFLIGTAIFFAAPALGTSMTDIAANPYASLSSVGSQMILQSKSRTGGWGLLSATLASLLALTGPLELKERQIPGKKDTYLLFRTTTFSMMFGGGVAWFLTVICMSDTPWLFLFLTLMSSMIIAFLGTCAAVFGHHLELQNFEEVEQLATVSIIIFGMLIFVAGVPQLIGFGSIHPFGSGGWLSTYLIVSCIAAVGFAGAVAKRTTKDSRTRGLGNVACCVSWVNAILAIYGTFGIAGDVDGFDTRTVLGIPLSVIGTIAVSPILLLLDGEASLESRGRRVALTTSQRKSRTFVSLNLPRLKRFNRWFPSFVGTISILLLASLYAVLLRGCIGGTTGSSTYDVLSSNVFGSSGSMDEDLVLLVQTTLSQRAHLTASSRLSASGFCTASNILGPLLHLAGTIFCFPTVYLMFCKWWWDIPVPSTQCFLSLPLNAIPLLLCRGIPSLRVAALGNFVASLHHCFVQYRQEQKSKMQM